MAFENAREALLRHFTVRDSSTFFFTTIEQCVEMNIVLMLLLIVSKMLFPLKCLNQLREAEVEVI